MRVMQGNGGAIRASGAFDEYMEAKYPWAEMVAELDTESDTRPFFRMGTPKDPMTNTDADRVQVAGLRWLKRNGFDDLKISRGRVDDVAVDFYLLQKSESLDELRAAS